VWIKLDAPMHFQAGQYVNLELPGGIGSRAFSIANAPAPGSEIELNIRIVPGRAPPTCMSNCRSASGEHHGPYGRFFVKSRRTCRCSSWPAARGCPARAR
jgi:phenol hydroxylase P5 protein